MDGTSCGQELNARQIARIVAALGTDGALCPLVVKGVSMVPTLREGIDTVYLRAVGPDDRVRRGDIAFFWRDGHVVLHRVVGTGGAPGTLRMNGDGQLWCEEIARSQVFAVVERVKRGRRVLPVRSGVLRVWGELWMRALPVRGLLWRFPRPVKRAVRAVGRLMRGGGRP